MASLPGVRLWPKVAALVSFFSVFFGEIEIKTRVFSPAAHAC